MEGRGFIQDKMDIKFLILYIADRLIQPVPYDVILDLAMCDSGVGYFDFSECLADLVQTENLSQSKEGLYAITSKGRRNSGICESSLPYSVRLRCDQNLADCNRKLRRKSQVRADYHRREDGVYSVRLALDDDMGSVLDLGLTIPHEDMAKALAERFRKAPERLYSRIMDVLLDDGQPDRSEK